MNYYEDPDLWLKISHCMFTCGGSFAACIAHAMVAADSHNRQRLEQAFRDLMDKYHPDNWK